MQRFEGQGRHVLALLLLLIPIFVFAQSPGSLVGNWVGISTRVWFWIAVLIPILHQFGVMLLWRGELHEKLLTNHFGEQAFTVFQMMFFPGLLARPLSVLVLALADRNSIRGATGILDVIAWLMIPPLLYLFYSIFRYFGIRRAAGADHFFEQFQAQPLVREGIYHYLPNAMYVVGFFIVWIPALMLASRAAILVAAYQHALIWAHYYFTEKPDMRLIYGEYRTGGAATFGMTMDQYSSLHDTLKVLELWTLDSEVRSSRELLDDLLADNFIEFGQSGTVIGKQEILEKVPAMTNGLFEMEDFQIRPLGDDHALVLYRLLNTVATGERSGASNRCSIWHRQDERWRMIFHQGTAAGFNGSTGREAPDGHR